MRATVSQLVPVRESPAERELLNRALMLIGLRLTGAGQDVMDRYCSAALARASEIRLSDQQEAADNLRGHLVRLCALLTADGTADGLPREWSGMIGAANCTDGAHLRREVSAVLPRVDGIDVRVDSLVSEPRSWRVHLRAEPGWWIYSSDRSHKRSVMSVHADDDVGGMYLSQFDGSTHYGEYEELTLKLLPRLNPIASVLTLTFTAAAEQATVELRLPGSGE